MDSQDNGIVQKKRGRPRKNLVDKIQKPIDIKKITNISVEREIILHLPIGIGKKLASDSDKNVFTRCEDTEDCKDAILTLTDGSVESEETTDSNVKELLDEIGEKDKIIRKLKDELLEFKSNTNENSFTATKDNKYVIVNLKLVDNKSGQTIICDKTNIACWWCTYNFDSLPFFIPEKHYDGIYYVFGCFCGPSCASAYNLNMNDYRMNDRHSLIKKMYNLITGTECNVGISPPRELLEKFGGPMNISVFRKNNIVNTKEYKLLMPPMVPIIQYFEEKCKDINRFGTDEHNSNNNKKKSIVFKKSSLFDSMGII
jgi:hypothetical protein